jgi:hypothetical protein
MRPIPILFLSFPVWGASLIIPDAGLMAAEISAPLGARRVTIQGDGGTTILGSGGLRPAAVYAGAGDISGMTLTCVGAGWTPDTFVPGSYVELEDGDWSAIVGNTADRLELEAPLPEGIGTSFRIVPFNTLNRLFGEANGSGFTGGRHIGEADILVRWDNAAQATAGLFYFNSDAGQWQDSFNKPAGEAVLYPDECLIVSGIGAGHEILLAGIVRLTPTTGELFGEGATNLLPNPFVFDVPVASSGLEPCLAGGPDIGAADFLAAFDPVRQLVTRLYYFNTREQAWLDSFNQALTADDVIPAGSGLIVVRHSAGDSTWRLEVPGEIEFTQGP